MNATRTRRQIIGSALGLLGAGAAIRLAGTAAAADGVTAADGLAAVGAAASATAQAERVRLPGILTFPVRLPAELILLDNFGEQRLFGSGPHQGIDIGRSDVTAGQPVVACIDGVIDAQTVLGGNEGNSWVLIDIAGDRYRYHHLEMFAADLQVGDPVVRGQVLGTMGSTGNPSAPHLHFEVRRGANRTPVDPVPLLGLPIAGVKVV